MNTIPACVIAHKENVTIVHNEICGDDVIPIGTTVTVYTLSQWWNGFAVGSRIMWDRGGERMLGGGLTPARWVFAPKPQKDDWEW